MASSPPPTSSSPLPPDNPDDDPYTDDPRLSSLEAEILNEYRRLRENLDSLSKSLSDLASNPSPQIADGLRVLERKTAVVCTALKSSVYGIVLQQQIEFDGGLGSGEGEAGG